MPSDCIIEFDKPNGVYNSGETLQGKIQLRTGTPKTARGVSITINGYAKVRWTERKSRQQNGKTVYHTVVYSASDQYLDSVTYVIGARGGREFQLTPGLYTHTFACLLPADLPTSCEGLYGAIRYEVIVTIDRPLMFDNVFKQAFTVLRALNLNLDPMYKLPKMSTDFSEGCCCCCGFCLGGDGTSSAELSIPFSGYAPGQKIPVQLKIDNDSTEDIYGGKVKLVKRIVFESRSPTRKEKYVDCEIECKPFDQVLRLLKKEFNMLIELPSIPPSTSSPNMCIRIEYKLSAKAVTGCCRGNLNCSFPVTIGTVPLYESATNPANIPHPGNVITQQPTAPTITPTETNGGDLPPPYHSMVPPSYEDAVKNEKTFEDDEHNEKHKEMPFVPKYPVYLNYVGAPTAPRMNVASGSGGYPHPASSSATANYGWASQ